MIPKWPCWPDDEFEEDPSEEGVSFGVKSVGTHSSLTRGGDAGPEFDLSIIW